MKIAAIVVSLLAAPLAAQTAQIAPGMTRDQVEAAFGRPASERHFGAHDYLLFDADCGRRCGDDLVILDHGQVADAVIRSSGRAYSGAHADTTLAGTASPRPAPPPLVPATAADSAHRSGMVFEGPRPPAAPPQYQVFVPHHDSTSTTPAPPPPPPPPPAAPHR
jgi:SmpA / OmlA family